MSAIKPKNLISIADALTPASVSASSKTVLTMSAIAGCQTTWRIIYGSYGILGTSVLPLALWCSYKHIKYQAKTSSNKLLYRLSIAVYLCTIAGSILTGITSFLGCFMSPALWFLIWYIQFIAWILQWFFFIWLLFSRYEHDMMYTHDSF